MLENLALSISTALFFLCNLFVYSLIPSLPSDTDTPDTPIFEADLPVMSELSGDDTFELVGEWNSGGRILEFTRSGKLIFNGQAMPYEVNENAITVRAKVGGEERVYTLSLEVQNERVMRLNGIAMYRTDP